MAKKRLRIEHVALGVKPQINSKKKGNSFELVAAKFLRNWTGEDFQRTPGSGGLRWLEAARIAGDVVSPVNSEFPFVVECKSYKDFELKVNLRKDSKIYTFWAQVKADSERAGKEPILFCRRNGMPEREFYVFVREKVWVIFRDLLAEKSKDSEAELVASTCIGSEEKIMGFKCASMAMVDYRCFLEEFKLLLKYERA